jgi:hypothetical protein
VSVIVPRLDRTRALEVIHRHAGADIAAVARAMPDLPDVVTYAPVGGLRIGNNVSELADLRASVVSIAEEHGMPGAIVDRAAFEGRSARLLHEMLPMTPHEASHEEVWSYLTCCWLLDVAMWRFGAEADERRFLGDVNRNTFRRMWWRAEILGSDVDLADLNEDELVSIMERPTIASDRRLARAMAAEFIGRVHRGEAPERMKLMREASKRLLRLTPFVAFGTLAERDLKASVAAAFERASASIDGRPPAAADGWSVQAPAPSVEVSQIESMIMLPRAGTETDASAGASRSDDFDTVAQVALELARGTGRVTNITLRDVTGITSDEARDVFRDLISAGQLVRKGVKRGTYYVLPTSEAPEAELASKGPEPTAGAESTPSPAVPSAPKTYVRRPTDSALRRLLRRGR